MTFKREQQIKDLEMELRLPLTKARRKDVKGMLAHAKLLLKQGR
jgi:hypothetical protein